MPNDIGSATPGALGDVLNYLRSVTGKPVIVGESGQINTNSSLTTSMMQEISNSGVPYAI